MQEALRIPKENLEKLIKRIETRNDCSPKHTILCTLKTKIKKFTAERATRARDCFLSANRKQWDNQSDSLISNRTQLSFY